jgi:hypothetical protein
MHLLSIYKYLLIVKKNRLSKDTVFRIIMRRAEIIYYKVNDEIIGARDI